MTGWTANNPKERRKLRSKQKKKREKRDRALERVSNTGRETWKSGKVR